MKSMKEENMLGSQNRWLLHQPQQSSVKCNIKTICQTCVWVGCWMSDVVTQPSRQWKCRSVFSTAFRGNKKLISQNINIKTQVITHQLKWLTCYSVRLLCWSSDQIAVFSVKTPTNLVAIWWHANLPWIKFHYRSVIQSVNSLRRLTITMQTASLFSAFPATSADKLYFTSPAGHFTLRVAWSPPNKCYSSGHTTTTQIKCHLNRGISALASPSFCGLCCLRAVTFPEATVCDL